MHQIKRKQNLPVSLQQAWEFFSDPANLKIITPEYMGFDITSEPQREMYEGMIITYKVSPLMKIPLDWMTEITHIRKPFYFVDEQRAGPYKVWHHQHHFREVEGGTEIIDQVDYQLPLGPLGKLANTIMVKKQLKEIFDYREKVLEEMFGKG
ncbi:MAG: SRPBCC family protein [Bacteroidales bacterium]|nr:SRPBCC family protein [Bacteroidales bacterium]